VAEIKKNTAIRITRDRGRKEKIELRGVTLLEESWHHDNPPPALPNITNDLLGSDISGQKVAHLGPTMRPKSRVLARGPMTKLVRPEGCLLPHREK
jgi:hypothetical protein